jgi:hypothetical protein
MIELKQIRLTKADLDRIPTDERYFYFMAGHLANDVNVLAKFLLLSHNSAYRKDGESLDEDPRRQAGLGHKLINGIPL